MQCSRFASYSLRLSLQTVSLCLANSMTARTKIRNIAHFVLLMVLGFVDTAEVFSSEYRLEAIATDLASVPSSDEAPVILADGSVLYMLDHRLMKGDGITSKALYEATVDSDIPPYSARSIAFNSHGDFVALCRSGRQSTLVLWQTGQTKIVDRRPASVVGQAAINDKGFLAYAVRNAERLTQIM